METQTLKWHMTPKHRVGGPKPETLKGYTTPCLYLFGVSGLRVKWEDGVFFSHGFGLKASWKFRDLGFREDVLGGAEQSINHNHG